jgi:hypothetical protein
MELALFLLILVLLIEDKPTCRVGVNPPTDKECPPPPEGDDD